MRVERRDFVDLGLREPHLGRERGKVRAGNVPVPVLNEVQMLDQQIAPPRPVAQQRADLVERGRIDLPALGGAARLAPARLGAIAAAGRRNLNIHRNLHRQN